MERNGKTVARKLIIDGNAVYEIDEECMLKKRLDEKENRNVPERKDEIKNQTKKKIM